MTAEVELEGTPVKAVIDTGSPVTIVSFAFLIDTLIQSRPPSQTLYI